MNQVANTSADLAEVLKIQERQSVDMRRRFIEQEKISLGLMKKMWDEAEALVQEGKEANDTKWLQAQINSLEFQLGTKRNRDEADVKRLRDAKKGHEVRLRRVLRARRKIEQLRQVEQTDEFKKMQEEHASKAALAREPGAEERLKGLRQAIALHDKPVQVSESEEPLPVDERTLAQKEAELVKLEDAFHAKLRADARDHPVTRDILPAEHKKQLPRPFATDIEIQWADLRNAEYAADNWPEDVIHDILNLRSSRQDVNFLNAEQYQASVQNEVNGVIKEMEREALKAQGLEEPEPEPEKTGVWKYLPEKNPFKRAEA
jgi:hypothetical protein